MHKYIKCIIFQTFVFIMNMIHTYNDICTQFGVLEKSIVIDIVGVSNTKHFAFFDMFDGNSNETEVGGGGRPFEKR